MIAEHLLDRVVGLWFVVCGLWFWVVYLVVDLFRSLSLIWTWVPHVLIGVEVFFYFEERFGIQNWGGPILLSLHPEMFSISSLSSLPYALPHLISFVWPAFVFGELGKLV